MLGLRGFLDTLRRRGELIDVRVPVDPRLEMTEIACRLVREGGPAVVFHSPAGATGQVALNLLGTPSRLALALGREPTAIAAEIGAFLHDAVPPSPAALWRHRRLLWRATAMPPRRRRRAPWLTAPAPPDLDRLPVLTCWPEDGGPFITWPLVLTRHVERGDLNVGLYRLQVHGPAETGMHWQLGKGGAFHHHAAEAAGRDLPCTVVLGADPLLLFAAMMPLPEGVSELAFAGFLAGRRVPVVRRPSGHLVPVGAEIVLEGVVPAGVRRLEGPFGDHFGHYSHAADFPVFKVSRRLQRPDPIYVAAVVGKPPQEDVVLGSAVQDMLLPLLAFTRPEVRDAWAHHETGFHGLLTVSMRPRYPKESIKTALSLLGEGQVSLTKCVMVVDAETNCRDLEAVLRALGERLDPGRDVLILANTSADTLDFTGPSMNAGSKMVLDLTGPPRPRSRPAPPDLAGAHSEVLEQRLVAGAALLVRVRDGAPARPLLARLLADPRLLDVPLVVLLSADVDLGDRTSWAWGWFTRFDPAADTCFRASRLAGPVAVHEGPIGIDATWKPGYPKPLEMAPEVVRRVDERWREYGF